LTNHTVEQEREEFIRSQASVAEVESQRLLAAIVESSEDAIVTKDLNGTITSWNQGAERIFGYTGEEVIGKSISLLIPPDHFDEEPGIIERIRRGERVEHYETVRIRKDGTRLNISLTVSPLRDASGRVRLWIEDNGIGIKPEHQHRIFGMFERLHPERNYEGTGVGLAIVRKAVQRMGGAVGVESDGLSGSRFWLELPMVQEV